MKNFISKIISHSLNKSSAKKIAIQNTETALSYSKFVNYIHLTLSFLKDLDVKKNDIVINVLGNKIEFVILHYATILLGATSVPLSNNLSNEKIKFYLDLLKSKITFTDKKNLQIDGYSYFGY